MPIDIRGIMRDGDPPMRFRFGVFFFHQGIPNPLDIKFTKVSGLTSEVSTTSLGEGGQNLYTYQLPDKINHNNLVLERGMAIGSPLNFVFNNTMTRFKFIRSNVVITLFDDYVVPLSAWLLTRAYPIKWSINDLDSSNSEVIIDTLELAYTRLQTLRV